MRYACVATCRSVLANNQPDSARERRSRDGARTPPRGSGAGGRRCGARRPCVRGGSRPGAPGPLDSVRGSPSRKPGRFRFPGRGRPAPPGRHAPWPAANAAPAREEAGSVRRTARIDTRIASVRVPYGSGKDVVKTRSKTQCTNHDIMRYRPVYLKMPAPRYSVSIGYRYTARRAVGSRAAGPAPGPAVPVVSRTDRSETPPAYRRQ